MAKTPSPKVIAAYLLRETFTNVPNNTTAEQLTSLVDSRVNDAKLEKVVDQFKKITLKLLERLQKVIDKFEDVPAPKKGKKSIPTPSKSGKVESTKKATAKAQTEDDDEEDEEDGPVVVKKKSRDAEVAEKTAVLKKKKKKKNRD